MVAVNDVANIETLGRLVRRDSTFGPFRRPVVLDGGTLLVDGRKVAVSQVSEPERLPAGELGIDVVWKPPGGPDAGSRQPERLCGWQLTVSYTGVTPNV